jgi:hypothetical protein
MKNILMIFALVFTGIQAMGQSSRSVSYTYFHSTVVADSRNGQACQNGSPNCTPGVTTTTSVNNGCGTDNVTTTANGTYSRFYKSADVNLSTLEQIEYTLKNKTQGNKVIYQFTLSKGAGWSGGTTTVPVTVDPGNVFPAGSFSQDASVTITLADGSIKIATPAIPMLFASSSDELEQVIVPTLTTPCVLAPTQVHPFDATQIEYTGTGCIAVSTITQTVPGVVASNGQTSANGAMLYDVKFSSERTDNGGWYLLDGRAITAANISNPSAREAAALKFGANLPNTNGLYTVATTNVGQAYNPVGDSDNEIIVQNSNIQSFTISTQNDGAHTHSVNTGGSAGLVIQNGSGTATVTDGTSNENNLLTFDNTFTVNSTDSEHTHQVSIGTGSPTPISIQPSSIKLYQLIYLGE